jgi:hypothetical protein
VSEELSDVERDLRLHDAAPEMLAMLKELEWSSWSWEHDEQTDDICPVCRAEPRQHRPSCRLAALIAKAERKTNV